MPGLRRALEVFCGSLVVLLLVPGSAAAQRRGAEDTAAACRDGTDNDGDGHVDCDDQDCEDFRFCPANGGEPAGDAQQQSSQVVAPPPTPAQRQLHVSTNPPSAQAAVDRQSRRGIQRLVTADPWRRTPFSFSVSPGMHTLEVTRVGFESVDVPIPAGDRDLLVDVEMSRPVFEAGIALTALGGALAIFGIAWFGAAANEPEPHEFDPWGEKEHYQNLGTVFTLIGSSFLIPGVLMLIFDRNRDTTYEISDAPNGA